MDALISNKTFDDATADIALDLPLRDDNDAGAKTVRDYFVALLRELWESEEGFSGKRPFGNSGWKHDVEHAFLKAGLVDGMLDEDGYIAKMDRKAADKLALACIERLGRSPLRMPGKKR